MKLSEAFPSNYLAVADIPEDGDLVLTMDEVVSKLLGQGEDAETKPVLSFSDHEKTLVLNKTNATTIAELYGDETDEWHGKKVALYSTEVQFKGKTTLGIRVRLKKPKGAATNGNGNGTAAPKRRAYEDDQDE